MTASGAVGTLARQAWRTVVRKAAETVPVVALVAPTAAPPVPEPDSLALVRIVVDQRRRLLADAELHCAAAKAAHGRASQALDVAKAKHHEAMNASSDAREDEALALAAARGSVLMQHALRDVEQAKASLDEASARLERERASVAEAERALGRENALHALRSDPVEDFLANVAHDLVQAVVTIRARLFEARERISGHNLLVAEYDRHRTAGDPRVAPLEGFTLAGHVAQYLQHAGGTFPRSNIFEIEWAFAPPKSTSDPLANIYEAFRRSVTFIVDSLEWGERNRSNEVPERGQDVLRDAAEIFRQSRDRGEAVQALDAIHRARGQVFESAARHAHEQRLSQRAAEEQRELRNRGRGRDARGAVVGPPEIAPTEAGPPETVDLPGYADLTVG
jgi:hypothetical protein